MGLWSGLAIHPGVCKTSKSRPKILAFRLLLGGRDMNFNTEIYLTQISFKITFPGLGRPFFLLSFRCLSVGSAQAGLLMHKFRVLSASCFRLMCCMLNSSDCITSKHSWDVKSFAVSTFFTSLLWSVFPLSLLCLLRWCCSISLRSMGLALYAGP